MRCFASAALVSIALAATSTVATPARATPRPPDGAALVRRLGARATRAFAAPGAPGFGALVRLPPGVRATDLGLREVAAGIARLWGGPASIVAFADAHPDLPIEVAPPLHALLDTTRGFVGAASLPPGMDGSGVLVGIADTGFDVTHPDFLDSQGLTRVAWLLDLSAPPRGVYPDLEQKYGSTDPSGKVVAGAVWASQDIDALLTSGPASSLPQDEAVLGSGRVQGAADDVVANTWEVANASPTDEHDRVLLEVVADTGDVGGDLDFRGQTDTGHLAERRVGLLGRGRVHANADSAALRASPKCAGLRLVRRLGAALADQLLKGRHDRPFIENCALPRNSAREYEESSWSEAKAYQRLSSRVKPRGRP